MSTCLCLLLVISKELYMRLIAYNTQSFDNNTGRPAIFIPCSIMIPSTREPVVSSYQSACTDWFEILSQVDIVQSKFGME